MSFTYAQLKTAIQDYTENSETSFVNNLSTFITQAEERILKSVQLSLFRKNVSGGMTNANRFLACPSDYLAPFSLSFVDASSNHIFLDFKDPDYVQSFNPDAATVGSPRYYAVFDVDNFILGPTPNAAYTVELNYFYRPASLTAGASDGTTWLSDNASIRAQAHAFRGELLKTLVFYMREAVRSDRTTVYNALTDAGQTELAHYIRRL
jgi:hypothetical protein